MTDHFSSDDSTQPLSVRIPSRLRDRLEVLAKNHRRSLTAETVERLHLACSPGGSRTVQRALEALNLPGVVRLRSSSTSADVSNLLDVAEAFSVDRLTFAARACLRNGAALVMILESGHTTILLDRSEVNMARDQRAGEVAVLMQRFAAMGLLATARFIPQLVPTTAELEPADAVERLLEVSEVRPFDLHTFLHLLSQHGLFDLARFAPASGD